MPPEKIASTDEAWETRALGASEEHAVVAGIEYENALNAALGVQSRPTGLAESLDRFDPERHVGEAVAVAPVGREFGSPDYERLGILDMHVGGTITESRAMELLKVDRTALFAMMDRDGLIRTSTEYEVALKVISPLVDADPERETPDGDRLEAWGTLVQRYEAQHFSFDEPTSAERDGLSVAIEKAALDNPELPLPFVRDIMVSLEEVKSGQVPTAYESDDGH